MAMKNPITLLTSWISEELEKGAPNPQHAILSTTGKDAIPHGRVIAIREINDQGLLFFTQRGTRKVVEITNNPMVSLTFWFELFEREVMIDGTIKALSQSESKRYWDTYPTCAQIRFHSYAPTSSQVIPNKQLLEDKRKTLIGQFQDKSLPMSEYYCGFRVIPARMVFYTYRTDELSDVVEYCFIKKNWDRRLLSP
ncbi:pyridoxine/pyridoxamine 5'-phosphate oxidase [Legionella pneumophila]|uniref:pyridoxine/pyridoxamine 5'-phosphate oxidase n=1 Tax=Legionella pneumophila TaxID=446 RepID=UPI00048E8AD7|nr:pyridoxamine 5'-phosphate oxidase family protein [Legionella pneumophila]HAT1867315.1 pyridoxamine 5'-phosphate oxidase [Legionella pneumophila]HAT1907442.1 pyridoxamine 5'-phosphate oxidase [Legionella pneumophila]HAT1916873.1 pyridoxamine 5'-phosphate oxidase [Legionella pneumophila]HAT1984137.1 pyridoxamine 5'-phosphate oxidase [Legionella pneumophila]HCR5299467.1 pyridoxamine 5'-phosphate oxidase family protein [Legionella pneumophila]